MQPFHTFLAATRVGDLGISFISAQLVSDSAVVSMGCGDRVLGNHPSRDRLRTEREMVQKSVRPALCLGIIFYQQQFCVCRFRASVSDAKPLSGAPHEE
jgi:hypothetical protein